MLLVDTFHGLIAGANAVLDHKKIDSSTMFMDRTSKKVAMYCMRAIQAVAVLGLFDKLSINGSSFLPLTRMQTTLFAVGALFLATAIKNKHIQVPATWDNRVAKALDLFADNVDKVVRVAAIVGASAQVLFGSPVFGLVALGVIGYNIYTERKAKAAGAQGAGEGYKFQKNIHNMILASQAMLLVFRR